MFVFLSALMMVPGVLTGEGPETAGWVTIETLKLEPGRWDGRQVKVIGTVHSLHSERGRRGSPFFMMVLGPPTVSPTKKMPTVQVFALELPGTVEEGGRVSVEGIYHLEGKEAGMLLEHFIRAEVIVSVRAAFYFTEP